MTPNPILRVIGRLLIPVILLFAFYVQFHGDYGPGGGFQAGVIFAAAFILHALVFGVDEVRPVIPPPVLRVLIASGVFLFAGTGVATMLLGDMYLGYNVLASTPTGGQHLGVFLVELGVGITVASVMITVFIAFAGRRR